MKYTIRRTDISRGLLISETSARYLFEAMVKAGASKKKDRQENNNKDFSSYQVLLLTFEQQHYEQAKGRLKLTADMPWEEFKKKVIRQ